MAEPVKKAKAIDKLKRAFCFAGPWPGCGLQHPTAPEPTLPTAALATTNASTPAQQQRFTSSSKLDVPDPTPAAAAAAPATQQARATATPPKPRDLAPEAFSFTPVTNRRLPANAGQILSLHPLEHPSPLSASALTAAPVMPEAPPPDGPDNLRSHLSSPASLMGGATFTILSSPATADGIRVTLCDRLSSPVALLGAGSWGGKAERSSCGSHVGPRQVLAASCGSAGKPQVAPGPKKSRAPRNLSWPLTAINLDAEAHARSRRRTDNARDPAPHARSTKSAALAAAGSMRRTGSLPSPKNAGLAAAAPGRGAASGYHADMSLDELVEALRGNDLPAAAALARRPVSGLQNFAIMAQQLYADGRSLGEARANLRKQTRTMLEC